jgi:hypothetical protein
VITQAMSAMDSMAGMKRISRKAVRQAYHCTVEDTLSVCSLHGTLFTYRKIAATLRHTKGLQIGVTTGARRLILTRRIPCNSFSGEP